MAAKLSLSPDILGNLKCSSCKFYLSVYPIFIKINGKTSICGRCKVPNDDDYIRDEAYEGIAQFLVFPCSQKENGCEEQLTPLNMKDHEYSCIHKKIDCPSKAYSRCPWRGPNTDLKKHFEDFHKLLLLNDGKFEVNFVNSLRENFLMPFEDEIFIVKNEIDARTETFTCLVEQIIQKENPQIHYNYYLRLETGNQTYSYKCPQKSTSPNSDEKVTKILAPIVKEQLRDPTVIIASIKIVKNNVPEDDEIVVKKDTNKNTHVDWDLLSELECPVCLEYMLPPIYQCLKGHCVCDSCKPNLAECPICKARLDNTQNFTLEKLTIKMDYPCKYHRMGCPECLKSSEIRKHEESCEYGPYDCPLNNLEECQMKCSRSEIIDHIENAHNNHILKSERINIPFSGADQKYERIYLVKFDSKMFKLCFKYDSNIFRWALQFIGPAEECKKFKYEVDVIDNSDNKLRSYVRGLCIPYTKQAECFAKPGNVILLYEQISTYITDTLSFRIRVLRE